MPKWEADKAMPKTLLPIRNSGHSLSCADVSVLVHRSWGPQAKNMTESVNGKLGPRER
jgi:hypothetical protein